MKSAVVGVVLSFALFTTRTFASDGPRVLPVGRAFPAGVIRASNIDVSKGVPFLSGDDLFVAQTNCRGDASANPGINVLIYSALTLKQSGQLLLPCSRYSEDDNVLSIASDELYIVPNVRSDHAGEDDQVAQSDKDQRDKKFLNTFIVARKTLQLVRRAHVSAWIDSSYLSGSDDGWVQL